MFALVLSFSAKKAEENKGKRREQVVHFMWPWVRECSKEKPVFKGEKKGNSLAVQWLGLGAFTAQGPVSIPGQGTKIPQAARYGQK